MINSISVFGLGKVGITLVAALVSAGYKVVGYDINKKLLNSLEDDSFHTDEPGVMERLYKYRQSLTIAQSVEHAIDATQVSFIIVPTPSNSLDGFSNKFLLSCINEIGRVIKFKTSRHCVSVISTVIPHSSLRSLIPALEISSEKKLGFKLGYCYNPSFIAQGDIFKGLTQPDYVLIGEADIQSGNELEEIHRKLTNNSCPITRMTTLESEITKIASNTHETMRVAFANMLLALCNELPGTNVDNITLAMAYRLGKRFFKGAVPYGGPCWPRDNRALSVFMETIGVPNALPAMVDIANSNHAKYLLDQVLALTDIDSSVGMVGLAYKPGTSMLDESFVIYLSQWLDKEGREVRCWDPMAHDELRKLVNYNFKICDEFIEVLQANTILILLPLNEINNFDWAYCAESTVIDFWRILNVSNQTKVKKYIPIGNRSAFNANEKNEYKFFRISN